jgi:hypothetical protein|tara:strand:- start:564 stop:1469 length:906 start_codon:yes stop_codon:yes gene_type:complete
VRRGAVLAATANATATSSTKTEQLLCAKQTLSEACSGTFRGSVASHSERAAVEEAQVALERFTTVLRATDGEWEAAADGTGATTDADGASKTRSGLNLNLLAGKWRLIWTNAGDVLSVLQLARRSFGLLEIGDITQSFTVDGKITNEIRIGVFGTTQPATRGGQNNATANDAGGGVALKVDANFSVMGGKTNGRTLALTFNSARLTELKISDLVETLVAPALLPRGGINHQILLALREFDVMVNLGDAVAIGRDGDSNRKKGGGAPVGSYHITYLDHDTLIGRANGAGGTFIFAREARESH